MYKALYKTGGAQSHRATFEHPNLFRARCLINLSIPGCHSWRFHPITITPHKYGSHVPLRCSLPLSLAPAAQAGSLAVNPKGYLPTFVQYQRQMHAQKPQPSSTCMHACIHPGLLTVSVRAMRLVNSAMLQAPILGQADLPPWPLGGSSGPSLARLQGAPHEGSSLPQVSPRLPLPSGAGDFLSSASSQPCCTTSALLHHLHRPGARAP